MDLDMQQETRGMKRDSRDTRHNGGRHDKQNPQPLNGFRLHMPKDVEVQVRQSGASMPRVTLAAFGGHRYGAIGRVLMVRHEDLTVTILGTVLPFREEKMEAVMDLLPSALKHGEKYQVLSIYRYKRLGTWFVTEDAATWSGGAEGSAAEGEFAPLRKVHVDFPIVSAHPDGDRLRGETLLSRINRFTGMNITLNTMQRFKDYKVWPLSDFLLQYPGMAAERTLMAKSMKKEDIGRLDELARSVANVAGFDVDMSTGQAVVDDQDRVDLVERITDELPGNQHVDNHVQMLGQHGVRPTTRPDVIVIRPHRAPQAAVTA